MDSSFPDAASGLIWADISRLVTSLQDGLVLYYSSEPTFGLGERLCVVQLLLPFINKGRCLLPPLPPQVPGESGDFPLALLVLEHSPF